MKKEFFMAQINKDILNDAIVPPYTKDDIEELIDENKYYKVEISLSYEPFCLVHIDFNSQVSTSFFIPSANKDKYIYKKGDKASKILYSNK